MIGRIELLLLLLPLFRPFPISAFIVLFLPGNAVPRRQFQRMR
jgi:hypothetical protein